MSQSKRARCSKVVVDMRCSLKEVRLKAGAVEDLMDHRSSRGGCNMLDLRCSYTRELFNLGYIQSLPQVGGHGWQELYGWVIRWWFPGLNGPEILAIMIFQSNSNEIVYNQCIVYFLAGQPKLVKLLVVYVHPLSQMSYDIRRWWGLEIKLTSTTYATIYARSSDRWVS